MRIVLFPAFCLLAGIAAAQRHIAPLPKVPTPAPRVDRGAPWKSSKVTAAAIAGVADAKIKAMRGVVTRYHADFWFGAKNPDWYVSTGDSKVRDGDHMNLLYVGIQYRGKEQPSTQFIFHADGKTWEIIGFKLEKGPLSKLKIDNSTSPADWVTGLPRYVNGGFRGESPFSRLVAMASKPGSGFKVSSEERLERQTGEDLLRRRIVIERTPAEAKRKGPIWMAIKFDVKYGLPIAARVEGPFKDKGSILTIWTEGWAVKPMNFPDSTFQISGGH